MAVETSEMKIEQLKDGIIENYDVRILNNWLCPETPLGKKNLNMKLTMQVRIYTSIKVLLDNTKKI